MKYRTTAKAVRENCNNVKRVGYCDLQYLFYYREPNAYTCGVYGWNFDVYELGGLTITTGYRGMIGERAKHVKEFEKRAESIVHDWNYKGDKRAALDALIDEFVLLNKEA